MNPELLSPTPAAAQAETLSSDRQLIHRIQESPVFRDYAHALQTITNLPLVLRAAGEFQAPMQGAKKANSFCALMAASNRTCAACLEVQARLEASATDHAETAECFAGLQESAVPIRVGNRVVGFLQTGQVAFRAPTQASLQKMAARLGVAAEGFGPQIEAAYLASRVMGKTQYESIIRMLEIFAEHLSAMANQFMLQQTHAEMPSISRARVYIAENYAEELSLEDVARAVGMSTFYFCKIFRREVGLTFTDYLSRVRVEAVKQLLRDPHKRVSEVAYAVGFQSLSQFNRVFSRIAGVSPSVFRDDLGAPATPHRLSHTLVAA